MQKALHIRTTVQPGGKIEIVDQGFPWESPLMWSSVSRRRQNDGPRLTFWPKPRVAWLSRRRRT